MRIVVVGGGIAGLAAAHRAQQRGASVLLVEQSAALGGKLRTGALAEAGADAFLVRDAQTGEPSAALELCAALGLADALVQPATGRAAIAMDGALVPVPAGTLFGIPSTVDSEVADRGPLLAAGEDAAVGTLVAKALGNDVVERFVEPILGGIYAGRADELSLAMTIPALALVCQRESSLTAAVRAVLAERPPGGPVFAAPASGMTGLVRALGDRLRGSIRTGRLVRELRRDFATGAWQVTLGAPAERDAVAADGVVLAVPGPAATRLLSTVDAGVSTSIGALRYASVVLVTLVLPYVELPALSGFLVPAVRGYAVKAVTFVDQKWPRWGRPDHTVLRLSLGRHGEEALLQRTDAALVELAIAEASELLGVRLPAPVDAAVHRWGGALPQYAPGHRDRMAAARAALPASLALAGAAYDGVGIAACVHSGHAAADQLLEQLGA